MSKIKALQTLIMVEAALSIEDFKQGLEDLIAKPFKQHNFTTYRFSLTGLMKNAKLWKAIDDLYFKIDESGHWVNAIYVEAYVVDDEDKDYGALWDANVHMITPSGVQVAGGGGASGGGGSAIVEYDAKGKVAKVISDTLKGVHIEEGQGSLSISVDCSPELYQLLRQAFGSSLPAPKK
jgi:hypothetical protein